MYCPVDSPNHFCEEPSKEIESSVLARDDNSRPSLPIGGPIKLSWLPRLPEPRTRRLWTLEDFAANPALLVMFLCNQCPYVQHLRKDIVDLANYYMEKGLGVLAISSNSVTTSPQDGPECMAEEARVFEYPFPYLYDESQDVARTFSAVCTPEFFLYKKDVEEESFVLEYHGQYDDSRPGNDVPVTGRDLRMAIDCVLNGLPVPSDQKPCVGCIIKWHLDTAAELIDDTIILNV